MKSNWTRAAVIVVVLLSALLLGGTLFMGMGYGWMNPAMMNGYGWMGPGMMNGFGTQFGSAYNPAGSVLRWIFWAILLAGGVLLVVWLVRGPAHSATGETPLSILQVRYARGELSKEQYDSMRRDLQ